MEEKTFYRFEDVAYDGGDVRVMERKFKLRKETPCGYWLEQDDYFRGHLTLEEDLPLCWVSKTARKRFAYPTRALAIESFVARKRQQIRYMHIKKQRAELAYDAGLKMLDEIKLEGA